MTSKKAYKLWKKALCVVESCRTYKQLDVADKYIQLAASKLIKQHLFGKAYDLVIKSFEKRQSLNYKEVIYDKKRG